MANPTDLGSARPDSATLPLPVFRFADSIKPNLNQAVIGQPLWVMASLDRLGRAIATLDPSQDALLRTADLILAEEQLRVELLRERLQMILEG